MKFRKTLSKIPKLALAGFMALTTVFSNGIPVTKAATYNLTEDYQADWYFFGSSKYGNGSILYLNGKQAFCIEPDKVSATGPNDTIKPSDIGLTWKQMEDMALITWYGYRSKSKPSKTDYMMTQNAVWRYLGSGQRMGNSTYPDESSMQSWFNNVMNKVNHFHDLPSFNNKTVSVDMGETANISDTNKVLSGLRIKSVTGGKASISGNTLKVTPDGTKDSMTIKFDRGMSLEQTKETIVVRQGQSQAVSNLTGYDPYRATLNVKVNRTGSLKITKQDEDGSYVPNTSFKLSKNADMSSPLGTYTTGSDGTVTVNDLDNGTWYVQETAVPNHLVLDTTIKSVTVNPNQTTTFTQTNNWKKGKIQLRKTDSKTGTQVGGATYAIYNQQGQELQRLVTTATGFVESGYLRFGNYTVKEVIAPEGYVLNPQVYSVTVSENEQRIEVTGSDKPIEGYIQVLKRDAESGKTVVKANTTFSVYKSDNTYVTDITTNNNGLAKTDLLRYGGYYLVEKTAPDGYTHSDEKLVYNITEDGKTYEAVLSNTRAKGQIKLSKEDSVTGKEPQGEATLEGAVYEVRAAENILDPADGSVLYTKDTLISTLTTDREGNASTNDQLYLGKYNVKEVKPSNGYTLDPKTYTVDIAYEGQNVALVTKSVTSLEKVISQPFEIIKISDNGNGESDLLAGVEFTIKAQKDIDKYGSWEKAPVAKNASGEDAAVMVTDKKGYALSDELPYGTYVVRETKTPADHYTVPDFTVTITEDSREPQTWRVFNDEKFRAIVAIVKQDEDTGRTIAIPGATFKIKDLQTNKYVGYWDWNPLPHYVDTWETTEDGTVMTGDVLDPGEYLLEEIKAPNGYVINTEPVKFTVTNDGAYQIGPDGKTPVITVTMSDKAVKGRIKVGKEGEVLTGITKDSKGNIQFKYETRKLPGATFEIYAAENIMSPDNQGDILYDKDELVETVITGTNGEIISSLLPLGKYYIVEKTAPDGFTHSTEKKYVELKYKDQETEVVYSELQTFKNERQKIEVEAVKKDKETNLPLSGAEFTMYAKEDILSYDGEVLVKAGEKVETSISGEDGKAVFKADLPLFEYEVRETKAPDGYASTQQKYDLDGSYKGQDTAVQTYSYEFLNEITKWDFTKKDITTDVEIPGAKMQVLDKETVKVIEEWISTREPHRIKGLYVGNTYVLHEELAPNGYLQAQDIEFTVKDTGEVQSVEMKDELVKGTITVKKLGEVLENAIKDKSTDGNYHFQYKERALPGMVFEVRAAEDIKHPDGTSEDFYKKGELVATLTTGKDGTATTEKLPLGKYDVTEVKAPEGYIVNGETKHLELKYKDQNTALVFDSATISNARQKVDIELIKKDKDTGEALSGAVFGLSSKKDIRSYDGKLLIKKGELIETVVSDENGRVDFTADLPLSVYEIRELKAPVGYASNDEIITVDASYKGQDVQVVEYRKDVLNEITKVEVSKKDITNNEEIEGAFLMVYPKGEPGAVFESWYSGQDGKNEDGTIKPHMIKGLEPNVTYILHEESSPYGYALAQDIEFTVKDTGEVQPVEMKDEMVFGQLKWNKAGEIFMRTDLGQTEFGTVHSPVWEKSNLLGAEITIYAAHDIKIGNHTYYKADQKVETLESDWDAVLSKKLPVGRYYYKETKVPHGYVADTEKHYFEVEDNQVNEIQIIESTLKNERPVVDIDMTKLLEEQEVFKNPDAYKDIVFGVYAREDIYNYKGDVAIPYDTLVYTSGINEDGHLTLADTFDLPNGVYYLKELSTNGQYVLNDKEYDFEISYHGQDVSKYTIKIGDDGVINNELARGSIQVKKVDSLDPELVLKDVEFNISADKDMKDILFTSKTDENGIASFDNLELGKYYVQEAKQLDGYVLNDTIYEVEVKADGDVLTIECVNTPTTTIIEKVDEQGNKLAGASLQILDEKGNVIDEFESSEEAYEAKYLVEGKEYTLHEEKAPYSYQLAEDIKFTVKDGQVITMVDKKVLTDIQVNKVSSVTNKPIKSKDFEFTLYADAACTKVLMKANANKEEGTATFHDLPYGTYYVKETKAPEGFLLSKEVKKVVLDENTQGIGDVYSFIYADSPIPTSQIKTGVDANVFLFFGTMIISGMALVLMSKRKDEKE